MGITYKEVGVDIQKGEDFVSLVKKFFPEKRKEKIAAFSSLYGLKEVLNKFRNPYLVASSDGVGTKLLIAQGLGIHNTVGIDLVAMNVNDIISLGARPLFFLDYIACGKMDLKVLSEVMKGLKMGLRNAQCSLLGGETAEMPDMYRQDEYDLAGFCVGIVDKIRIIDGSRIRKGDIILGMHSSGIHSNGYSLVRKVFTKKEIKAYAHDILKPTRIYVKPVMDLLEKFWSQPHRVGGIAHITGGAFYTKAVKIIPEGLGIALNKKSWSVPRIFRMIQEKGNIDEKEMYSVFNMGMGMIIVVKSQDVKRALSILNKYCKTSVIGEVVKSGSKLVWI